MKILLLASLAMFMTSAFSQVLPPVVPAKMSYQQVAVYNFVSAVAKVKHYPSTSELMGRYEGQVEVTVLIEGNLCSQDPQTLGTVETKIGKKKHISLIVGGAAKPSVSMCEHGSRLTPVTFSINVLEFIADGEVLEKGLGVITIDMPWTDGPVETEIRIQGQNGEIKVEAVKI